MDTIHIVNKDKATYTQQPTITTDIIFKWRLSFVCAQCHKHIAELDNEAASIAAELHFKEHLFFASYNKYAHAQSKAPAF